MREVQAKRYRPAKWHEGRGYGLRGLRPHNPVRQGLRLTPPPLEPGVRVGTFEGRDRNERRRQGARASMAIYHASVKPVTRGTGRSATAAAAYRAGDERNYHAHILTTTREITPTGFGRKTDVELGETDRKK